MTLRRRCYPTNYIENLPPTHIRCGVPLNGTNGVDILCVVPLNDTNGVDDGGIGDGDGADNGVCGIDDDDDDGDGDGGEPSFPYSAQVHS